MIKTYLTDLKAKVCRRLVNYLIRKLHHEYFKLKYFTRKIAPLFNETDCNDSKRVDDILKTFLENNEGVNAYH